MRPTALVLLLCLASPALARDLDLPELPAADGLVARTDGRGVLTLVEVDATRERFALARERRQGDDHAGRFGRGWRSWLDAAIERAPLDGRPEEVAPGVHLARDARRVRVSDIELVLDAHGRVVRARGHELDLRYAYDAAGELVSVVDRASGRRRRYERADARSERVLGAGGWLLHAAFDDQGRVRALATPGGSRTIEVAPDGLILRADGVVRRWFVETDGRPERLDVTWGTGIDERLAAWRDTAGRVVVDTPWGRFAVERDAGGRAREVRGPFGAISFLHDAAGRRARVVRSNGVVTRTSDDGARVEHLGPAGEGVLRVERRREGGQEVTRVTAAGVRETRVARDAAGRLLDAWSDVAAGRSLHVIPARDGARVERDGAAERWVTDAHGRLVAAGGLRLSHDARGRVVRVEGAPGRGRPAFVATYVWDDADRLVRARRVAADGASSDVAYAWSDAGRLLERQDGAGVTRVVEGPLVRALLGPGGRVRVDVLDPDAPDGPPLATSVDGDWTFMHDDGAGSVLAWTDARGRRVDEAAFSATGELEVAPALGRPLVLAGQEVDREVGLVLVRGRPFAPWLGRWLSPDPAAPRARAYVSAGILGALDASGTR